MAIKQTRQRILIVGAGIAGSVLAYWLGKYDFEVVVLERSKLESRQGQVIDVEGPAYDIVKRMGLLEQIKSKSTHEQGVSFVDSSDKAACTIPVGTTTISNEIEIMRTILAEILIEAAAAFPNVDIRYGCTVRSLSQASDNVTVELAWDGSSDTSSETFDILVASDGLRSRTRDMIISADSSRSAIKSLQIFAAFFSIPAQPQDRPFWRLYNSNGRRGMSIKPLSDKESSTSMTIAKYHQDLRDARESRDVQSQKEVLAKYFQGTGWESNRILAGMMKTDNFYFEEICQVFLDKWSHGRCVLLGDTAYAPSPLTGQGTNLAILGAYVLASKLVKFTDESHPRQAFEEYDKDIRPYVRKQQSIPVFGYAPFILNPDTDWGIWLLRKIGSFVCWLQVWKWFPDASSASFNLPEL